MADLPSFGALFRIARDEILARNTRLSKDAVEREGMDTNILVAGGCAAADEVIGQLTRLQAALYLDSAKKADLDRLVFDRYGLTRKPAAASVGSVRLTSTTVTGAAFAIPKGTTFQSSGGTQFVSTEDAIFPVGSMGPINVSVRSVLAGATQTAKAGAITAVVSSLSGAPAGLAISNPFATAGADDAELDDALRDRARRYFLTTRRGTLAALESAALAVSGVRKATAFEVVDALGRPARLVQLVISDAFTDQFAQLDSIPARYQTQSQNLSSLVFDGLADVRVAGTYVQVVVAQVILQAVQLALSFNAGAAVDSVALQARAAVVSYMNALAPGQPFVAIDVLKILKTIPGLKYTGSELVSPVGNVIPKPLQAMRTTLGIVAAISVQTNTPIATGINPDAYAAQ